MEELGPDNKKAAVRESRLLQVLNHDNIIRFKEVYKTNRGKLCIVMDYADAGNIYDRIRMQREIKDQDGNQVYFDKDQVLQWIAEISLAIKYCHDRKVLHRDIKSANILLTKNNQCKLCDFGCSRVLSRTKSLANTNAGTPLTPSYIIILIKENLLPTFFDFYFKGGSILLS